jgi:hypothetical protein
MLVVMQTNVLLAVLMVNLSVAMDLVYLVHGHVTAWLTVQMVQMKIMFFVLKYLQIGRVQILFTRIHGVTVDVVHMIQYVMILMQANGITVVN